MTGYLYNIYYEMGFGEAICSKTKGAGDPRRETQCN
jgi:hypothetical protein